MRVSVLILSPDTPACWLLGVSRFFSHFHTPASRFFRVSHFFSHSHTPASRFFGVSHFLSHSHTPAGLFHRVSDLVSFPYTPQIAFEVILSPLASLHFLIPTSRSNIHHFKHSQHITLYLESNIVSCKCYAISSCLVCVISRSWVLL